jgi:RimJ/RimL family protein N-acetyltransferase
VVRGDESVTGWVLERLPWVEGLGKSISFAVLRDSKIIAAAVYNNFFARDCQLTFVADDPQWASRQVVRQIWGFPFYEADRLRITVITDIENQRAIKLAKKLDFKQEGVLRHGSPIGNGSDGVIYGLTKEDFLRSKYCER